MISFEIHTFQGALPIRFGLARPELIELLGVPTASGNGDDSWGKSLEINVGYDAEQSVDHIGFRPGAYELRLAGRLIWLPGDCSDPIPLLLELDPRPLEHVGFLVFTALGVKTTGFHDDDPSQRSLSLYKRGAWDRFLPKAKPPDLRKYHRTG